MRTSFLNLSPAIAVMVFLLPIISFQVVYTSFTDHNVVEFSATNRASAAAPGVFDMTKVSGHANIAFATNHEGGTYSSAGNMRPFALTKLMVNFQDASTVPPSGWLADFGQPYGLRTSANQGTGNTYGWVKRLDGSPLDMTAYGRKRTTPSDLLLATFIHMQPAGGTEGKWEALVANGTYDVTVSVGDGSYIDSKHYINIEGKAAIVNFIPTTSNHFKSATVTVTVSDGKLTVDAIGGTNTKINYISIQPSTPKLITVSPLKIYDNDVIGGAVGINRVITIKNTSNINVLSVSNISLAGTNSNQFVLGNLPSLPVSINPNNSINISVAFNPSSTGIKTATVDIKSNDAVNPTVSVSLRGLGTSGTGGTNEPSLQAILNLLEIPVSVGDDNVSTTVINSNTTAQKAPLLGEEVSIQQFVKAGTGNVTIEPLDVFGPTTVNPVVGLGWYHSGDITSRLELFSVSNSPASNGQTVNVNYTGTLSFDPGTTSFGFYSRWPFFSNRHLYSEDNLNTFTGSIPHHVRVYPYKNQNGVVLPSTYIVAFEENTSGFDYQDIVFVVKNVKKAAQAVSVNVGPIADANTNSGNEQTISGAYIEQNVPNPFNNSTIIGYYVPQEAYTFNLHITDMRGTVVKTLNLTKGKGQVIINNKEFTEGTYIYSLWIDGKQVDSKKMVLLK
ncbi:hypothetical protein OCK74_19885 [Chitinophagaceae bacterium LB-8]|uniref:Choice-of-anchor D domain-containing protein n=1 Tax=Paraflavisolibacter caeni TaxID=2982496 RepID=A0A9X3BJM2_9BACT|nr:hypothetical protein [Paraflavisolibacter caeni]MCU7551393.1 hypothetical protein [Paraflavisolibacter caeni]